MKGPAEAKLLVLSQFQILKTTLLAALIPLVHSIEEKTALTVQEEKK